MFQSDSAGSFADILATLLGYVIGSGSLMLYTPIAVRVIRKRNADGLTLSTWWLKLMAYTFQDVYSFLNGYDISTYNETCILAVEAAVILVLVVYFQSHHPVTFLLSITAYVIFVIWMLMGRHDFDHDDDNNNSTATSSPSLRFMIIELGQLASACLSIVALIPQMIQNAKRRSSGDYSPVTATLGSMGNSIRCFTTIQLNGADPLLLGGQFLSALCNISLLGQIIYYGTVVEGQTLLGVFASDVTSKHNHGNAHDSGTTEADEYVVSYDRVRTKEEQEVEDSADIEMEVKN